MEVQNDISAVIEKWEPLANKMAWQIPVSGMEMEDVLQELRMVTARCNEVYDSSRGVASFKTYLYTAMKFKLLQLRSNVAKLATTASNTEDKIQRHGTVSLGAYDVSFPVPLGPSEALMADLKLVGYSNKDIKEMSTTPKAVGKAIIRMKREYSKAPNRWETLVLSESKGFLKAYRMLLAGNVCMEFCTWDKEDNHTHRIDTEQGNIPEIKPGIFQGLAWNGSCAFKTRK